MNETRHLNDPVTRGRDSLGFRTLKSSPEDGLQSSGSTGRVGVVSEAARSGRRQEGIRTRAWKRWRSSL